MTLDLIRPETSDIKYKIHTFSDGEPHIQIEMNDEVRKEGKVYVHCRITNPTDLFILQLSLDILSRHTVEVQVTCYYLMSQRMDRVMDFNRPYSLGVVLDAILPKVSSFDVLDPHFDLLDRNNTLDVSSKVNEINSRGRACINIDDNTTVIFPDESAKNRYGYFGESIYGVKERDLNTGKITSYELVNTDRINPDKEILVYDDLCDGGYTFKLVADELEKLGLLHKASIYVTHAVNPKGIELMRSLYKKVYITNSYADYKSEGNLHVIDVC